MYYGSALGEYFARALIAVLIIAAAIGGLIVWLAPKVWAWIKPIIHAVTA